MRLRIYVRYETSSIIRYVQPLTGDVFITRFADCHFNEVIFLPLGEEKKTHEKDVSWNEPSLLYLDSHTKQSKTKVQKIMHLQEIANQLPDAFTDTKRVTKSHIPAANSPARVNYQISKLNFDHDENVLDETQDIKTLPEEEMNDMNIKMSINYSQTNILWNRNEMRDIDKIFSYSVASDIMSGDDDPEPKSVIVCQNRPDWDKWKDVISLNVDNDPFRPCEEGENVLGPEVPYLSVIRALMYLTNCTRPDISFAVNLLARFSSSPTKKHWNGIKHVFRYLRGTTDLGLYYSNNSKQGLVGYADAGYLSDPHKARSQTGYVLLNGGTTISWRS
uniref:Retrotransposon protein, putative, Ty1-copia subclass n=1 Tax=Tanacetum cinerariifolium TaxID=118510 RepID=A0A6L2LH64_TANCI|nr:retrotransposon protein, putative, Ty1-copia subclass [Tanacetum cinerariifolium]